MQENYQNLSLHELYDLLLLKSEKLLNALEDKKDGYAIRDLSTEIKDIRALIETKKLNTGSYN
jgi:hypothetical protein